MGDACDYTTAQSEESDEYEDTKEVATWRRDEWNGHDQNQQCSESAQ